MSLELATWVTAVATVLLAVGAGITARFAYQALQKQSDEVKAIEQQVTDQRELTAKQADLLKIQSDQLELQRRQFERDQDERRRAQAAQVYMWQTVGQVKVNEEATPGTTVAAYVRNTSPQPVHELIFHWEAYTGDASPGIGETFSDNVPLMPGSTARAIWPEELGFPFSLDDVDAVAIFRDYAGVWWRTEPNGHLEELPGRPVPTYQYYDEPPCWEVVPDVGNASPQ